MRKIVLLCLASLLIPALAQAQLWVNHLSPSRAANWQGMVYDPPDTSTWAQCPGSPISPPSSSAAMQAVIDGCGTTSDAGQRKVVLNAGTFTFATGFQITKSNLVVEGAGANLTEIQISTGRGCNSWAGICFVTGSPGNFYYDGGGSPTIANITAGAVQGSTSLTVSQSDGNGFNPAAGAPITAIIRQLDEDNSLTYAPVTGCLYLPQTCIGEPTHHLAQQNMVTAKSCNGTTCTLTLQSPLYYSGFKQSLSPQIWTYGATSVGGVLGASKAIQNVGIRNLKVTPGWTPFTSGGPVSYGAIQFVRVYKGWAEGVTSNGCDSGCIGTNESMKITLRNNYLYNSRGAATSNVSSMYGFVAYMTTDLVIYNNIIQQIQAPILFNGHVTGSIVAYNFTRDQIAALGCPSCTFPYNWASLWGSHSRGNNNVLYEGNDVNTIIIENLEGNTCCYTFLRNFVSGREPNNGFTVTRFTMPFDIQMISGRFSQALGNVMGTKNYHNNYESSSGTHGTRGIIGQSGFTGESAIFRLGQRDASGETCCTLANKYDDIVPSSFYRWGNFDTVTNNVRWCGTSANTGWSTRCGPAPTSGTPATEVPSGQFVPSTETVPASFYLTAKPSWFGNITWPPIGPEVTGGNVNNTDYGGRVYKIPARVCAESLGMPSDGTGSILNFNAANCYGSSIGSPDTTPPAAPTNITIQ